MDTNKCTFNSVECSRGFLADTTKCTFNSVECSRGFLAETNKCTFNSVEYSVKEIFFFSEREILFLHHSQQIKSIC